MGRRSWRASTKMAAWRALHGGICAPGALRAFAIRADFSELGWMDDRILGVGKRRANAMRRKLRPCSGWKWLQGTGRHRGRFQAMCSKSSRVPFILRFTAWSAEVGFDTAGELLKATAAQNSTSSRRQDANSFSRKKVTGAPWSPRSLRSLRQPKTEAIGVLLVYHADPNAVTSNAPRLPRSIG